MARLLDTQIFIAVVEDRFKELPMVVRREIESSTGELHLSVASLWEIAIKWRLGKLPLKVALRDLPDAAARAGIRLMTINAHHALAPVQPEPPTRDPGDRLLLAQCAVEGLKLVTIDTALTDHPLSATKV